MLQKRGSDKVECKINSKEIWTSDSKSGSILEAAIGSFKTGSLLVSTSTKLHTLSGTCLKIGETERLKNICK